MADPRAEISAKLKDLAKSWSSYSVTTHADMDFAGGGTLANPIRAFDVKYIETANGYRLMDQFATLKDGTIQHIADYCDGEKSANVSFDGASRVVQRQIYIKKAFGIEDHGGPPWRPVPFKYHYAGKVPLHEIIPRSSYLGERQFLSRPCHVFMIQDVDWVQGKKLVVVSLDSEHAVPLCYEVFDNQEHYEKGVPSLRWKATAVEMRDSRSVQVRSVEETFELKDVNAPRLVEASKYEVQDLKYNVSFEKSAFWPEVQPGVTVYDTIAKKYYQTPGEPSKPLSTTAEPIRAVDNESGTTPATLLAFGLAGLLLLVATVLWWRGRS